MGTQKRNLHDFQPIRARKKMNSNCPGGVKVAGVRSSKILVAAAALLCSLPEPAHSDCSLTNTGHVALNDLGPGVYGNFVGGLYLNGTNTRPPAHEAAGLDIATMLSTNTGTNVLLSIGMSNTTQEFASKGPGAFKPRADADPAKNPRLVIVDGAQGGQDATTWTGCHDVDQSERRHVGDR